MYNGQTMQGEKIRIVMEGLPENGNGIPLSEFGRIIGNFHKLLQETAKYALRESGKNGKPPRCDFLVSDPARAAPATVEIRADAESAAAAGKVFDALLWQKRVINKEKANSKLPDGVVKKWKNLAAYKSDLVGGCTITLVAAKPQKIFFPKMIPAIAEYAPPARVPAADGAPGKESACRTSATGWIKIVDLHARRFTLTPRIPRWNSVEVHFPAALEGEVVGAVNKVAEVSGIGHRRPGDVLPYKMEMERIRVLPDEKDLPKLSELQGKFNITNGKPLQQYLDEMREAWER